MANDWEQNKFYGGEVAPIMRGRKDIKKDRESLSQMYNTYPHKSGAASNRPGLEFIAPCSTFTGTVVTEPFVYNNDDTYTMELTNKKLRFMRGGGFVLEHSKTDIVITDIASNVHTSNGHPLVDDDFVYVIGDDGVGLWWFVDNATTNTYTLKQHNGDAGGAYADDASPSVTIQRIYTVVTPYLDADLESLRYSQKADTMTITHQNYHPAELTRSAHTNWTLSNIALSPLMSKPLNVSYAATSANDSYFYIANSITDTIVNITAITLGATTVVQFDVTDDDAPTYTTPGAEPEDNLHNGRLVSICCAEFTGGSGTHDADVMEALNGLNFILKNRISLAANGEATFDLHYLNGVAVDTSAFTSGTPPVYTSRSAEYGPERAQYRITALNKDGEESFPSTEIPAVASDLLGDDRPVTISWNTPTGNVNVDVYYIYKESNGIYGFIGEAPGDSSTHYFNDRNIAPELGENPPEEPIRNPFQAAITIITQANPCVVTAPNHGHQNGHRVRFDDIVDMVELNHNVTGVFNRVNNVTDDTFEVQSMAGVNIDSSGFTPYVPGVGLGTASDFPRSSAYFRQRRGFASKFNARQTVDHSATGLHSTFTKASDAFSYRVDEAQANDIRHMMSGSDLLLFTSGSTILSTSGDAGFSLGTVTNIEQMTAGISETVPPLKMRNSIIFVQDKFSQVFDLAYTFDQNKYLGQDLTLLAPHLIEDHTIVAWGYQKIPEPIVWCVRSNGSMIALLYERDNNIFGWHYHDTPGNILWTSVTPEGSDESPYFVVERLNPATAASGKFHERMWNRKFTKVQDCKFMDSYRSMDSPVKVDSTAGTDGSSVSVQVSLNAVEQTADEWTLAEDDFVELDDFNGCEEVNLNKYRAAEVGTNDFYLVNPDISLAVDVVTITGHGTFYSVDHAGSITLTEESTVYFEDTSIAALDNKWFLVKPMTSTSFEILTFDGVYLPVGPPWAGGPGTMKFGTRVNSDDVGTHVWGGVARLCKTVIRGLWHITGWPLAVLSDGNVVPNMVAADGFITLPDPAARVHVGIPFQSAMESLDLDTPEGKLSSEIRSIERANLKLHKTRGIQIGPDADNLETVRERSDEDWGAASKFLEGEYAVEFPAQEDNLGKYYIVQNLPLPFTVQSVGLDLNISEQGEQ